MSRSFIALLLLATAACAPTAHDEDVASSEDALDAAQAKKPIWNKWFGCEPNDPRACTTNADTPPKNVGWRQEIQRRLGRPTSWNPNVPFCAQGQDSGGGMKCRFFSPDGRPLVADNRVQAIAYATFERGQIYAFDDPAAMSDEKLVFEVVDDASANGPKFSTFYASKVQPNGTNSFLGLPASGLESCGGVPCQRFAPPSQWFETGRCSYLVKAMPAGNKRRYEITRSAEGLADDCSGLPIPAQFQDMTF